MGFLQSTMRSRSRQPLRLRVRVLVLVLFLVFIVILALRSATTRTEPAKHARLASAGARDRPGSPQECPDASSSCTKLPPTVAEALIHYAASNVTPQQTPPELGIAAGVLGARSPCNFLVFGLGHDSLLWATLNYGGRTIFLEEDKGWMAQIAVKHPQVKAYHVEYSTMVTQADELLRYAQTEECRPGQRPETSGCRIALRNLPAEIYDTEWDAIMIDAPRGYFPEAPGRMTAIYTAGVMARNRKKSGNTDVFVHDVDRSVEENFSKAFLCEENLVGAEGRLWHFSVPANEGFEAFCLDPNGVVRGQKMERVGNSTLASASV